MVVVQEKEDKSVYDNKEKQRLKGRGRVIVGMKEGGEKVEV